MSDNDSGLLILGIVIVSIPVAIMIFKAVFWVTALLKMWGVI